MVPPLIYDWAHLGVCPKAATCPCRPGAPGLCVTWRSRLVNQCESRLPVPVCAMWFHGCAGLWAGTSLFCGAVGRTVRWVFSCQPFPWLSRENRPQEPLVALVVTKDLSPGKAQLSVGTLCVGPTFLCRFIQPCGLFPNERFGSWSLVFISFFFVFSRSRAGETAGSRCAAAGDQRAAGTAQAAA